MNKEDYQKISLIRGLPNRCPILNYCVRRIYTIYFYSDYDKVSDNVIQALRSDGLIPDDFDQKRVSLCGEVPVWSKGLTSGYYYNMCPEVNLFDTENQLPFAGGIASSDGDWDFERANKFINGSERHFSECAEFNKVIFERAIKKPSRKKRKSIPNKTRVLLQKEINSKCPCCPIDDVEHFHIHHIDENPENNQFENLLMLCPTCHSKITKGDKSKEQVLSIKKRLKS